MPRHSCLLPLLLASALHAADSVAAVRTSGQFDADGSVLYSVYVASGPAALSGVAVGGTVPLGARFLESVDVPAGVLFEGVRDNVAVWSLPGIGADRVVGPFTFRVRPDGAAVLPASSAAAISYEKPEPGISEFAGSSDPLEALADSGEVIFDERGTLDAAGRNAPVLVGRTGILLFVPEGAYRTQTTLRFARGPIEPANLPADAADTWWCGLYRISASPDETSAKPISFTLPTRRALPFGLPVTVFGNPGTQWAKVSSEKNFGFGGGFSCSSFGFGNTGCGGGFSTGCSGFQCSLAPPPSCVGFACGFQSGSPGFGFGVAIAARNQASISGTQIAAQTGLAVSAIQSITDGTSNIIAILIGRR